MPGVNHVRIIAITATGTELLGPNATIEPGKIFNSNGIMLKNLVEETGGIVDFETQLPDDADLIKQTLEEQIATHEIVITDGGVSVGDFDFIGDEARKAEEEVARKVEEERQRQIAEQKAKSNKMNFEEIRAFNFQSIQSEWQPVAIAINYHNGEGYVWETNVRESNLNVTTTQISGKMAGLLFNLDANGLSTGNSTNLPIHLNVTDGVLNIASADGGMAWNILFYPKEVEIEKLRPDDSLPESIHANTEHIAVRASGMGGPTVVYERMS